MQDQRLKTARGNAQRKFDEICRFIADGDNSMALMATRMSKAGAEREHVERVWQALHKCIDDARAKWEHAIAIPEPPPKPVTRLEI